MPQFEFRTPLNSWMLNNKDKAQPYVKFYINWVTYSKVSIKRPVLLNVLVSQNVFVKRTGLSQVLNYSAQENQDDLFF